MSPCYRILHLDDVPMDAQLVELALEAARGELCTTLTYVQTKEEFLAALERGDFDIILSDYRMPGFDGDEALKAARKLCPEVPFIMVTGELGEERVIETLQRGATDYVLKSRIFRLVPAITRALAEAENRRRSREIETALWMEHQRTREILESIGDAFYSVDRGWHFTYINHHAEILWGRSARELLGKALWEAFPEADGSDSQRRLLRAMEHRVSVHYETQSPLANTWVEVHAYPSAEGGLTVYFREITERKRTEEALRKSEERFRLIADTMPVMVWTADARGTVDYGNLHSRAYAGIPEPVPGEPPSETPVHPDDAAATKDAWQRSIESGEPYEIRHRLRRADGIYRWHLSRAVPVRNDQGTIIKWYGTATDIHEIREANEELERRVQERTDQLAAANRELEAFTSSVSHDLKAPLRVIEAYSGMLAALLGGGLSDEERKILDGIAQNVMRMDKLINGLLQFSRLAHAPLML
ncbi:MAG TPA: PAS domain S-box protein, partial [Bacteroidota bacterium]